MISVERNLAMLRNAQEVQVQRDAMVQELEELAYAYHARTPEEPADVCAAVEYWKICPMSILQEDLASYRERIKL